MILLPKVRDGGKPEVVMTILATKRVTAKGSRTPSFTCHPVAAAEAAVLRRIKERVSTAGSPRSSAVAEVPAFVAHDSSWSVSLRPGAEADPSRRQRSRSSIPRPQTRWHLHRDRPYRELGRARPQQELAQRRRRDRLVGTRPKRIISRRPLSWEGYCPGQQHRRVEA